MKEWILFAVVAFGVLWWLFRQFFKRTAFERCIHQSVRCEINKNYAEAIALRKKALETIEELSEAQRADLLMGIGGCYMQLDDATRATEYFDQAFSAAHGVQFPYDKAYQQVVNAYVACGRRIDALRMLDDLISRQQYDKRFQRLEKLRDTLLHGPSSW